MNRNAVVFELSDICAHVLALIKEIDAGEHDDVGPAYQISLQHLQDHLSRAWHYAKMPDTQIDTLTTDEFAAVCNAIPRFGIDQRLV